MLRALETAHGVWVFLGTTVRCSWDYVLLGLVESPGFGGRTFTPEGQMSREGVKAGAEGGPWGANGKNGVKAGLVGDPAGHPRLPLSPPIFRGLLALPADLSLTSLHQLSPLWWEWGGEGVRVLAAKEDKGRPPCP